MSDSNSEHLLNHPHPLAPSPSRGKGRSQKLGCLGKLRFPKHPNFCFFPPLGSQWLS